MQKSIQSVMKRNVFVKNAPAIRAICVDRNVDVGVAAAMWAAENNILIGEVIQQYDEYRDLCRVRTLDLIATVVSGN